MPKTQSLLEEELRRGSGGSAGWPWRLLIMTAIALSSAVVVYFGLETGYRPYVESQVRQLDAEIANLDRSLSEDDKQNLLLFYSRLNNINSLLKARFAPSQVFTILEQSTLDSVHYRNVTLDTERRTVLLEGIAPQYRVLTEQLVALKNNANVASVDLRGSQRGDDLREVTFSIMITLAPTPSEPSR